MATIKQKRAAKKTLENMGNNEPATIGDILIDSGYSEMTATHNPKEITESEGYINELDKLLKEEGIDRNSRLKVMAKILYSEDKRSAIGANKEITNMLGEYAPSKIQVESAFQERNRVFMEVKE